ncbi:MAG: transposase [Nitrospira sp.]|nr:transposase [Nitrospira sp.]
MARPLRIEFAGAFYHVIARGTARQDIFLEDEDRHRFLRVLEPVVARSHLMLHTYCLMDDSSISRIVNVPASIDAHTKS